MKEAFRSKNFGADALALIAICNGIIEDYQSQDLRLTLRGLYYQLVRRNTVENTLRSYKRITKLISDGRLAGLVDWDAIEDGMRVPHRWPEWGSLADLVADDIRQYRLPRWKNQLAYVELWVEKDALANVLTPLADAHHVTLMVNRGYSSQTAMHDSAIDRFGTNSDKDCILFYLGDHDPSGEDMVRDIRDRFEMFGVEVEVRKLALTMAQVRQYRLPPNPAKVTDPRASAYIARHGNQSWEVDALPPNILTGLINEAIEAEIDGDALQEVLDKEKADKKLLLNAARKAKL